MNNFMDDKQIRLEILLDYYKAMRNQTEIPGHKDNEKYGKLDKKDYDFNYGYLVKHDLVKGSSHYSSNGVEYFAPNGGITGDGIDVVENFIDRCVDGLENKTIEKSLSYMDKILELVSLWSSNLELYQQAWDLLASLIP